jgi:DNA modification methylase
MPKAVKRKAKSDKQSAPTVKPILEGLRVEQWPIERLRGYPGNPRKNDVAVDRMCEAIKEFGFRIPVVARSTDGLIVDGHLRHKAALKLGLATVPVALADELTEVQIKAFRLLANASSSWAEWDVPLLKLELESLRLVDYPLALTGFDDVQLVSFMAGVGTSGDPEVTPEPPAVPVSMTGDLWLLGKHRLLCGDATSKKDVERLLGKAKPHLMVTDPPYGVEYDPAWRNDRLKDAWTAPVALGAVKGDDKADWSAAWNLFPGDVIYAWNPPGSRQIEHHNALVAAGFEIRMQIIWAKPHFPIGRGNYHVQHEPCWYAVRKGRTAHWNGDRTQSTLWTIDNASAFKGSRGEGDEQTGHGTQKPVECMKRPIENNSRPGDAVYDPFVGSFTTGIACEMTGRQCLAIEIAPEYVDVGVQRWQTYTKKPATLEATGQTFDEVAAERSAEALAAE